MIPFESKSRLPAAAAVILAFIPAVLAAAAAGPDSVEQARQALAAAARAYQRVAALEDTLTYTVKTPSAVLPPKTIEIKLGAGRQVAVKDALFEAIALDDTLYVTKSDAPGKYVAHPYSGDFAQALDAVVGDQAGFFEPVQVAMRSGKDLAGWLRALRFNQLAPLTLSSYEKKKDDRGRTVEAVHCTADNGNLEADFDAATHLLSHVQLRIRPAGAPPDVFVEISGVLSPRVLASARGLIAFDRAGRTAVPGLTALDSASLPTGKPAPAFELERVGGGKIALAALRGSVVVLDFWATWCAPCWSTLRETQRLADWAAASGKPVAVLAVDTLEEFPSAAEKRTRAAAFFRSQGFTMPGLLDLDNEVFKAFGTPGLPSMVVIAPDGTIFKFHQGLFPRMLETLEREIGEASQAAKR
ncbi:MAG TPA: TlpA disulfide reductase family protein [Thermoanaerobaculia bacterium]|nr:TlpA disulfide reductase family protein [Thermoanaerobaculia bacterium]